MLSSCNLVGFLVTKDYDKARAFFETKLGFQFISLDQYALAIEAGAHLIRITRIPNFTPARNTVLGWEVQDIEAVVPWLKQRAVVFEKYPFIQDPEIGIWTAPSGDKVAWFKDPDGNVLSVSEHVKSPSR
ncbi:MAG TPA: VOC family protein [Candidatus Udaeobacter sp.]|jgi:catechol 2,3-dioxygenase-like lactoylglutathione lyase family enzyme|nr:VOC family protein [Candidatus Udaeobacter sp.]